jgi:hypothetical protein
MAALKEKLFKWLDDSEAAKAPERHKLATRLIREADDEETAGLINRLLDDLTNDKGGK